MTTTEQQTLINSFIDLFKQGVDAWIKAGEILVQLVEADPHTYDYIIQQCPTINAGILGRFEQMGRKTLHPQLLLASSPGFSRLQKLPFSMQQRYVTEPVALIVETDNGPDVLLVKAKDMTKEQAAQAFAPGRLRTEGEQRAYLMDRRSMAAKPIDTKDSPWKIRNGKLEIKAGVTLTKDEVAAIYMQMTRS